MLLHIFTGTGIHVTAYAGVEMMGSTNNVRLDSILTKKNAGIK